MLSGLKLVIVRAMLYILSDMLGHLMHVETFTEIVNSVIDPSMLSVIMCHFEHFRVTVLWDAESSSTVAVRLFVFSVSELAEGFVKIGL